MLPLILPVLCAGISKGRLGVGLDLIHSFDGALRGRYARSKRYSMMEPCRDDDLF